MKTEYSVSVAVSILSAIAVLWSSCNPEAKYATKDVEIIMDVKTVSAGFIECDFATNKEAYYLIDCVPAVNGEDPLAQQKQFMTLALDKANKDYIEWRNQLLKKGEFNIAPFASHSLQYGDIHHFFTGLMFEQEYWIYAFVVDPEAMKPVGKLYLQKVKTEFESIMSIRFDYRVNGAWDYIYPMDSASGNIHSHFPYVCLTMDSIELMQDLEEYNKNNPDAYSMTPEDFFALWLFDKFGNPEKAEVHYGVTVRENGGFVDPSSYQTGHTYYTFIGGFDFSLRQNTLYKFRWENEKTEYYFSLKDNLIQPE
jgi:hypothetical protein